MVFITPNLDGPLTVPQTSAKRAGSWVLAVRARTFEPGPVSSRGVSGGSGSPRAQAPDEEKTDKVSMRDFVDGCQRLRGLAKSIDVNLILYENERMMMRPGGPRTRAAPPRPRCGGPRGPLFGRSLFEASLPRTSAARPRYGSRAARLCHVTLDAGRASALWGPGVPCSSSSGGLRPHLGFQGLY